MQLFVHAQQTHTLQVTGQETVADLKNHVAELEGFSTDDATVYYGGHPLEDNVLLAQNTADLATLELDLHMLGGKVHGSLARAGKVKGQTPKVEKQEKKKKKTGRAKRRIQYNRRFVNVVQTFGRRKGPNSNS